MSQSPVAFLSYVRLDDQHESGRLTEFCKRLSGELTIQTGEKFHIFQDQDDIEWGQQWLLRINESLDAVTFLIPIITPGFFKSPSCRDELERFLDREKSLNRNDLILPVYYVTSKILDDPEKRKTDSLAEVIAARQRLDWREFRFEPFASPLVGKMIERMAKQIVAALERDQVKTKPAPPRFAAIANSGNNPQTTYPPSGEQVEATGQTAEASRGPEQKTEPSIRVVDALHRGHHSTLTDALHAAKPGDKILVRPGLYKEGVAIEKPVEIIGDGDPGEVVIEATGKQSVLFKATMGRITNLTLRQAGGGNWASVDIAQGRLDLDGCDITGQGFTCVAIRGGADPRLRRNRIHDGKHAGVFVFENGLGTFEDNDIFGNALAGVCISQGGNPTLRRNRIHDGLQGGVMAWENGQGTLEDNDIFGNALAGMEIKTGGNLTLRGNRIHDGKQVGVMVWENGQGTLEDNDIFGNALAGVEIKTGGNPTLRRNRISKNGSQAIRVSTGGGGVFEGNDLRGNAKGSWEIAQDCLEKVQRANNQE